MSDKRIFKPYHETPFALRDAGLLKLRVKRFSVLEKITFERDYDAVKSRESDRLVSTRLPGEEQDKAPISRPRTATEASLADAIDQMDALQQQSPGLLEGAVATAMATVLKLARVLVADPSDADDFVIRDAEIRRRRLAEMCPEARAAWDALVVEEDTREAAFIAASIAAFVTMEKGQIFEQEGDGPEVCLTSGADLLRLFGASLGDMRALVQQIYIENALSEERKKGLRSLFDSGVTSAAPNPEAAGSGPDSTATPVDETASDGSADATALPVM